MRDDEAAGPGVISVATTAAYLVPVLMVAVFMGEPWRDAGRTGPRWWRCSAGPRPGRQPGAWSSADRRLAGAGPRSVPRAVVGAQLVMLAAGAAVLVTGLVRHLDRVEALHSTRSIPGSAGGIALLLVQLALVPNAFVWAGSYALGAGFSLGTGSVVAPAGTELGILPGLPLLGALPGHGPGGAAQLWWLAAGVLAGAVAAWIVVRSRPAARFDETSLVGGLAGVLAGAAVRGARLGQPAATSAPPADRSRSAPAAPAGDGRDHHGSGRACHRSRPACSAISVGRPEDAPELG